MTFRFLISALLAALIPLSSLALPSSESQFITPTNILPNPGFESGRVGWTASGGSVSTTNSTASSGLGSLGYEWNSNAASQTLTSRSVSIPVGLQSRNGLAYCHIRVPSGSATHTLTVDDGTNNIATPVTVASSSTNSRTSINFRFPSSGSIRLKLSSVASDEPSIYIDDCYLGEPTNISNVSGPLLLGTMTITCSGDFTTASASFVNATGTGCSYAATGSLTSPSVSNGLGFRLPNGGGAGSYVVTSTAHYGLQSASTADMGLQMTGGGFNSYPLYHQRPSGPDYIPGPVFTVAATSSFSASDFLVQIRKISGTGNALFAGSAFYSVIYYPQGQAISVNADQNAWWRVDANISGANPSLGTAAVSSFTGIENASLTLVNNSGTGNLTAQIPCSSTNAPTGTTCSAGNESVGVSFTPVGSFPQDVLACVSFSHNLSLAVSSSAETSFQIVETPNNAQTISQEGRTRLNRVFATNATAALSNANPFRVCGTATFSSAGQRTLRLMFEQAVGSGSITASEILADASASAGQRDIHWEVYPLNVARPATTFVGSITSNTAGLERAERMRVAHSAGTPSITDQSGGWVSSLTDNGAGDTTINIAAGIFSAAPTCVCSPSVALGRLCTISDTTAPSATLVRVLTKDDGGTNIDTPFNIQCFGPR